MNIEITPKKTDGLERLIEVRVPIETVRDAEDRAARRYATRRTAPRVSSRKGATGDDQEAFQGRDPSAGDRVARPGSVSGSPRPREVQGRVAAARPRSQVRGGAAAQLRASRGGAARGRAGAYAGVPRHAARDPTSPTTPFATRSNRFASRKPRGRPVEGQVRRRATWSAWSSAPPTKTARSPSRASTRWSSVRARRSPASKS